MTREEFLPGMLKLLANLSAQGAQDPGQQAVRIETYYDVLGHVLTPECWDTWVSLNEEPLLPGYGRFGYEAKDRWLPTPAQILAHVGEIIRRARPGESQDGQHGRIDAYRLQDGRTRTAQSDDPTGLYRLNLGVDPVKLYRSHVVIAAEQTLALPLEQRGQGRSKLLAQIRAQWTVSAMADYSAAQVALAKRPRTIAATAVPKQLPAAKTNESDGFLAEIKAPVAKAQLLAGAAAKMKF
jgi:hypothetical protein